jgi:hypothetical protein
MSPEEVLLLLSTIVIRKDAPLPDNYNANR